MKGTLLSLCWSPQQEDGFNIEIEATEISIDDALQIIKEFDRDNLAFDLEDDDDNQIDYATYRNSLNEIKNLAWPGQPNEEGEYVLKSAWAGGRNDMGIEWRFVPFTSHQTLPLAA